MLVEIHELELQSVTGYAHKLITATTMIQLLPLPKSNQHVIVRIQKRAKLKMYPRARIVAAIYTS